jgi:hypothetical protein
VFLFSGGGMRVRTEDSNGWGRVIVEYVRLEDFDALMEQIAGDSSS